MHPAPVGRRSREQEAGRDEPASLRLFVDLDVASDDLDAVAGAVGIEHVELEAIQRAGLAEVDEVQPERQRLTVVVDGAPDVRLGAVIADVDGVDLVGMQLGAAVVVVLQAAAGVALGLVWNWKPAVAKPPGTFFIPPVTLPVLMENVSTLRAVVWQAVTTISLMVAQRPSTTCVSGSMLYWPAGRNAMMR